MKRSAVLAVLMLGALLLGAAYVASPYYAVHAIKSAAQEKDFIALHEYVDYPAVRESLRDQVLTLLATEVLRKGASNSPVAVDDSVTVPVIVAQFLEGFIQPDSMISALLERGNVQEPKPGSPAASKSKHNRASKSPASGSGRNNDDRRNASPETVLTYHGMNRFEIAVRPQSSNSAPLRFVLARRGVFHWDLIAVLISIPNHPH